jgi:hypothetical protein
MSFNAPERPSNSYVTLGLAAATTIQAGELVARNSAGNVVPAADTAGLRVIGRAEADANNASGSAGDVTVLIKRGVFRYDNGTAALTAAHVNRPCFIENSTKVQSAAGTNSIVAGLVIEVDSVGVWVDTTRTIPPAAVAPTLASTDGTAAAASASLANLAAETEKIGDDLRALVTNLKAGGIIN